MMFDFIEFKSCLARHGPIMLLDLDKKWSFVDEKPNTFTSNDELR